MNEHFKTKLLHIVSGSVEEQVMLKEHTTFRIGGPADYFVEPASKEEIRDIIALCKGEGVPYYIIGNGSNLLVSDSGFHGVMIHIGKNFSNMYFEEDTLAIAQAGIMLNRFAMEVARRGLTGFEFAAGIPGTLGGAVTMNAGAYGGEIKMCIEWALVLNQNQEFVRLSRDELELSYRNSRVQKENLIVLEAAFRFEKGDVEEIMSTIADLNQRRQEKQPLNYPSAGSTFKRPEGYFAGKLIMDAGLRGYTYGGAMVSEKHCGFVINAQNATAEDVKNLMEHVDSVVYEKNGVHLEPEVRFVGDFE